MITGDELLRRFLKSCIEDPADGAHLDDLLKVFLGVLHFYKCIEGHPTPYHDITQFIYNYKTEIRIDDLNLVMDALELKLQDFPDEAFAKCFRKFRRNILLAVTQKYYIQKVASDVLSTARNASLAANDALQTASAALNAANEAEEKATRAANLSGSAKETLVHARKAAKKAEDVSSDALKLAGDARIQIQEAKKSSENMMVNYVTILGIFATIIITVFGGINIIGSAVKLLEGNSKLAYLVFVVSFLMICLLTLIRTLTTWISALNNYREEKVIVGSPKSFYRASVISFLTVVVVAGIISYFNKPQETSQNNDGKDKPNSSNVLFMNIEK
ncbi:hypothetical protein [Acinetobacter sp. BMW17]|uniref:hypothetical protein n=1 Tax=Acinetobacter sp. BMW17 TaxID=1795629 RepID=UPI000781D00C|nr:hypothetical protein [Acinetobacter sp. BMW17]